jgi:hypothetical protein
MGVSDELQAAVDRHLGLLDESIRQDGQMLAYIDEQLEPVLRGRRYLKVGVVVAVALGMWLLALTSHWIVITLASLALLITLGFCHIALAPKRPDDDFTAASGAAGSTGPAAQ